MTIKDVMHKPTFVEETMTVEKVAQLMSKKNIGSVIVGTNKNAQGIFSERDILRKIITKGINPKTAKIKNYMTTNIHVIPVNKRLIDALNVMTEKHIRRLPVEKDGIIVGMLSSRRVSQNMKYSYLRARAIPKFREKFSSFW